MEATNQGGWGEEASEEEDEKSWGPRESGRPGLQTPPRDEVKVKKHRLHLATWRSDVTSVEREGDGATCWGEARADVNEHAASSAEKVLP